MLTHALSSLKSYSSSALDAASSWWNSSSQNPSSKPSNLTPQQTSKSQKALPQHKTVSSQSSAPHQDLSLPLSSIIQPSNASYGKVACTLLLISNSTLAAPAQQELATMSSLSLSLDKIQPWPFKEKIDILNAAFAPFSALAPVVEKNLQAQGAQNVHCDYVNPNKKIDTPPASQSKHPFTFILAHPTEESHENKNQPFVPKNPSDLTQGSYFIQDNDHLHYTPQNLLKFEQIVVYNELQGSESFSPPDPLDDSGYATHIQHDELLVCHGQLPQKIIDLKNQEQQQKSSIEAINQKISAQMLARDPNYGTRQYGTRKKREPDQDAASLYHIPFPLPHVTELQKKAQKAEEEYHHLSQQLAIAKKSWEDKTKQYPDKQSQAHPEL